MLKTNHIMHSLTSYSILTSTWYSYDPQTAVFYGQYTTKRPIQRDKKKWDVQTLSNMSCQSTSSVILLTVICVSSRVAISKALTVPSRNQILPSCSTSLHSAIQIFLSCGSVIKTNEQIQKETKSLPVDQVPNYLDAKLLKNQLGNLVPNNYWEVLAGTRCDVARLDWLLIDAGTWIAQSSGPWLKRTTPT